MTSPPEQTVPVTVVTGFLGAGKSTLLERWLEQLPAREVAVIVNEQGTVDVDGALLGARVERLRAITGGCVCCRTQDELRQALVELASTSPCRILVETSGAASPAGVIRALTPSAVHLDGVVTVVDATRLAQTLSFDLAIEQLGFADVVVLSHADLAAVKGAEDEVARWAPGAVFALGRAGEVDRPLLDLLAQRSEVLRVYPSDVTQHEAFDSVGLELEGDLDEERFGDWVESALGDVEARILRIKGIMAMAGVEPRVVVQGVGEAVQVTLGRPWGDEPRRSRLVVIGLGLDREALTAGFSACGRPPST